MAYVHFLMILVEEIQFLKSRFSNPYFLLMRITLILISLLDPVSKVFTVQQSLRSIQLEVKNTELTLN